MTGKKKLALEWELGRHDSKLVKEIREGIDCEHDEELLPNSPAGFASMRNWGGSAMDCRSLNKVHSIASENHCNCSLVP
jgi:hypothetical protein